ncbi:MAG TPA: pirin family protein [Burkholderiaceae bacterium]|nr:pirin family protein [Burkholderiaceae bacterium]
MLTVRRSEDRGHADHGWLQSYHSFAFADYYDANHIEFGALRVINEDTVAPGMGFATHGHSDMEIISYVLDGQLQHKDSMGNGSIIRPGDVQRMSAGRGVLHSEFNPSLEEAVHFLQIWIKPNVFGIAPSYEQKHFSSEKRRGKLVLIASAAGDEEALRIHQDACVYAGLFDRTEQTALVLGANRLAYVHVARGSIEANGLALGPGDGLKAIAVSSLVLAHARAAEVLVFDLPGDKDRAP